MDKILENYLTEKGKKILMKVELQDKIKKVTLDFIGNKISKSFYTFQIQVLRNQLNAL